jgi:hypothetical protein
VRSILAHWQVYRDQVFPGGMDPVLRWQLQQTFFSGARCALEETIAATVLPEDVAAGRIEVLRQEVKGFREDKAVAAGRRARGL